MAEINWQQSRILVTRGEGLLGSHLVEALVAKEPKELVVFGTFSREEEIRLASLSSHLWVVSGNLVKNKERWEERAKKADVVFHMAGLTHPQKCKEDFEAAYQSNVEATRQLLEKVSPEARFIFLSTSTVYPESEQPINETEPSVTLDAYPLTMRLAELLIQRHHYEKDLPATIVRVFPVFGPRQEISYLIPSMILQGLEKKGIELDDPEILRDFIYVTDVCDAIIAIAQTPSLIGEIVNAGSGEATRLGDLAKMVGNLLGVPVCFLKHQGGEKNARGSSCKKLLSHTSWKPKTPLFLGLQKTIQYYKDLSGTRSKETPKSL